VICYLEWMPFRSDPVALLVAFGRFSSPYLILLFIIFCAKARFGARRAAWRNAGAGHSSETCRAKRPPCSNDRDHDWARQRDFVIAGSSL
jgi:hypothetical protein